MARISLYDVVIVASQPLSSLPSSLFSLLFFFSFFSFSSLLFSFLSFFFPFLFLFFSPLSFIQSFLGVENEALPVAAIRDWA